MWSFAYGQQDALVAAGCEQVFIETASGKLASRPTLEEALRSAGDGDQLVITKLDRLDRSLEHLIASPASCRGATTTSRARGAWPDGDASDAPTVRS